MRTSKLQILDPRIVAVLLILLLVFAFSLVVVSAGILNTPTTRVIPAVTAIAKDSVDFAPPPQATPPAPTAVPNNRLGRCVEYVVNMLTWNTLVALMTEGIVGGTAMEPTIIRDSVASPLAGNTSIAIRGDMVYITTNNVRGGVALKSTNNINYTQISMSKSEFTTMLQMHKPANGNVLVPYEVDTYLGNRPAETYTREFQNKPQSTVTTFRTNLCANTN